MPEEEVYTLPEETGRRPLTARNLDDYALCPRKYLLSFFEPRGGLQRFLGGPAALGRALRQTLIEYHRRGGAQAVCKDELLAIFEDNWDPKLCADSLEEEQLHADGVAMLAAYHSHESNESGWKPDLPTGETDVADVDLRMEVAIGGERFVAVADRVDELSDGGLRLVRFTSSRQPPSPGELAKDTSALLLLLVANHHFAGREVQVAYYALRPGRLIAPDITREALKQFQKRILRRAAIMRRDTEFEPRKGKQCRWCRSRSQCPIWQEPSR